MATQKETWVWKLAQLLLSPHGWRLFRNQRYKGKIVAGNIVTKAYADCGVGGDGGSDLIGWVTIVITPEMINKKVAVFTALEAKTETGVISTDQKNFLRIVNESGGIGKVIRTEDDIKDLVKWRSDWLKPSH